MKTIINRIKFDLHAIEPMDVKIRVDNHILKASPNGAGRWNVVIQDGPKIISEKLLTNIQLEKIATDMVSTQPHREFDAIIERDRLGYCVSKYYKALQPTAKVAKGFWKF